MRKLLKKTGGVIVILLVWVLIRQLNLLPKMVLPGPYDVFTKGYQAVFNGDFILIWLKSLMLIVVALLACIISALGMALLSDKYSTFKKVMDTLSTMLHPLPGVAILPLMIHWFGPGLFSVLAVMVHSIFWPVYLGLLKGVMHTPNVFKELSLQYELTGYEKIKAVIVPSIIPDVITASKIGWSRGWRSLISAEMIFGAVDSRGAIGWYLFEKRVFGDISGMIFTILVIMITGILIEKRGFEFIERKTVGKWSTHYETDDH